LIYKQTLDGEYCFSSNGGNVFVRPSRDEIDIVLYDLFTFLGECFCMDGGAIIKVDSLYLLLINIGNEFLERCFYEKVEIGWNCYDSFWFLV
jgi:hypothetical protein